MWATNDLTSGSIFTVDGFAKEFSDFPKQDGFSSTDLGADAAKACVASTWNEPLNSVASDAVA